MNDTLCDCKLKCYYNITRGQRQQLFDGFWRSRNFNIQNAYICGCMKLLSTKRRSSTEATSRCKFSRVYYVKNSGVSTEVCKTAFLHINGVSNGRVNRALQASLKEGRTPHQDQRVVMFQGTRQLKRIW